MRLFGQYLVEQGAIDEEALLRALLAQVDLLPTLSRTVFESKALSYTDQLRVLAHQTVHGVDYQSAAVALGLWTTEVQSLVRSHLESRRVPIGHVLVSQGLLSLASLTEHLDSFLASFGEEPGAHSENPGSPTQFERRLLSENLTERTTQLLQSLADSGKLTELGRIALILAALAKSCKTRDLENHLLKIHALTKQGEKSGELTACISEIVALINSSDAEAA